MFVLQEYAKTLAFGNSRRISELIEIDAEKTPY
jgi:hypothetical protein